MAINKVVYGSQTLIDLTTDTVASADDILLGKVGHLRDGTVVTGTASGGDPHGTIWQDGNGNVHLDDESGIALQSKTVTPTESQQIVEAGEGYYALDTVTVNAISSSYVGSGVTRRSSSDLTASGATVTVPAGYYSSQASKAVASGTAGTPTATKSAVSNHAVTVTPSVTNTTGYITGSTKTGTAVTVSASELVSGSQTVTSNQTVDVTNLAELVVNVPSSTPTLITKNITANGTYNASSDSADGYSSVTVNVSGGGGEEVSMDDPVRFFDYDGTLLHSYSASNFQALTAMPSNPSHSGLTAQGWNWTLADAKAQVTAMGACDIGQMYVTDDGKTRLYCHFEEGRLAPYLAVCPNGAVVIDWGDNSATDTLTGTSITARQNVQHTYASAGDYVITITATSGTFGFYGASGYYILSKQTGSNEYVSRVYTNSIIKIELGTGVASIGNRSFDSCHSLETITIPNSIMRIGQYAFNNCYSLKNIIIPSGVTIIDMYAFFNCTSLQNAELPNSLNTLSSSVFRTCYSLLHIVIPNSVTSMPTYIFYYCFSLISIVMPSALTTVSSNIFNSCYSLRDAVLPSNATSIASNAFNACYSLAVIEIPSSITSIESSAFNNCYGLAEIHFKSTTPPTVANSNAFTNLQTDCKIYVPTGTLSDYTSATNYPSSSTYTYIEE